MEHRGSGRTSVAQVLLEKCTLVPGGNPSPLGTAPLILSVRALSIGHYVRY